jgi:hypothetical protein
MGRVLLMGPLKIVRDPAVAVVSQLEDSYGYASKRGSKWEVQIRRLGSSFLSRSFLSLKDAQAWAR